MRTMIVDDEPLAVEELADTCEQFEDVQIVGRFLHAAEALAYAERYRVAGDSRSGSGSSAACDQRSDCRRFCDGL